MVNDPSLRKLTKKENSILVLLLEKGHTESILPGVFSLAVDGRWM